MGKYCIEEKSRITKYVVYEILKLNEINMV